jgi:ATP-binding cassette, subfamily B, bacterial MsbA
MPNSTDLYERLVRYLIPYKGKVFLAIFCSIIVGLIATSPVPIIQKTFDEIFVKKDTFMLTAIPLALVGLYLIKGALSYLQNVIIFGISWELVVSLRNEIFYKIQRLPLGYFEDTPVGELLSRFINDVTIMQSSITNMVKEFLQNAFMLVGLICWVFYLKWDWAIMSLFVFPLAIVPIASIARKLRHLSRRGQEIIATINSTVVETFSGIKVVRGFSLEKQQNKKLDLQNDQFLSVMKNNVKYTELSSPLMEILGMVSGAFILWYGGNQVLEGRVTQGSFIAFVVALFMMYGPIRLLFKIYTKFQGSLAGAERVFFILDQDEEDVKGGDLTLNGFKEEIEFRNVSFKYPSRSALVLNDINLMVKKSSIVAIVGMSGAGKTTLVDLLFRFYLTTEGNILIDGVNINDFDVLSLRSKLALVTQETFLFNDTIRNNIAFGKKQVTDEEIMEASRAAHVDNFVKTLDNGYETEIGERGVKLSGGQKQRIAIARAILRNAPILVLDEATSSLDSESEKLVQDALNALMQNRTTLIIAHRLSTIKNADRIIVLDQGKIVEEGSHDELLSNEGVYKKYYEMQFSGTVS